ncbi:hypothetical protein [Acidocella aminolytica]|uniref:Uncharacterized protein n=1 Tax=Acidocella aminolytica 101 = DSM 11237 TaxID=1120923 RepID=A0A0D6PGZ7_9PROT|nr:hypothetical protein [Acidocella aminolytica]GAN80483.1 hypothetical protein Aam_047_064 [Acidocella aminolytica 101 = DSM 11237]GBQ35931.1 hypothetical protein AA11237_1097 [Acidocella aminolytica 101 = DSM 11237]SHE95505.1 hypothetical protein SAMN02746095_01664 [Acidocella aminolytica 101 = DSM 11237]
MTPEADKKPFTLKYRASFTITMLITGVLMTLTGVFIVVGSLVLFRPFAIFAGIFIAIGGIRLLRRYGAAFARRHAAYEADSNGLHFLSSNSYCIPWRDILGLHVRHLRGKPTDLYIYLKHNPGSSLFYPETDPRAAIFSSHRPESPNQLHLRLSHFTTTHADGIEAGLRAWAPRNGEFPEKARVLDGHLSRLNWMAFTFVLTGAFIIIAVSIMYGIISPRTIAIVCTCMALPAALFWAIGKIQPYFQSWSTPRLITYDGKLYAPGSTIGAVELTDILNIRYRVGMLTVLFTQPKDIVKDYQFNRYGVFAQARLRTKGSTRKTLAAFFKPLRLWENGKRLDYKKIQADQKLLRQQRKERLSKQVGKH